MWSSVSVLSARLVSFAETAGLVLADDVVATENVPPFANTAVDGFALHSADVVVVPATLRVIGTVAAGDGTEWTLRRGEALRIMTGAPMPAGADAVVMVEECEVQGEQVIVRRGVGAGVAVRPVGDDVRMGDTVFRAGETLKIGRAHV